MKKSLPIVGIVLLVLVTFFSSFLYFSRQKSKLDKSKTSVSTFKDITNIANQKPLSPSPVKPTPTPTIDWSKVTVPEPNTTPTDSILAIPRTVLPLRPDSISQIRVFDIVYQSNNFSPKKIAVYQNDVVSLDLVTKDQQCDFGVPVHGIKGQIDSSSKKNFTFQAFNEGIFDFFCNRSASGQTNGLLLAKPRS